MTRFIKDRSAAAAIEFALITPLLILLYFGAVEFGQALIAKRKVTSTTSAIGDLVTRTKDLGATSLDDMLAWVPKRVMAPFPADNRTDITVTCAALDEDKVATVKWSVAHGKAQEDRTGSKIGVPDGVALPDSKLVSVKVTYSFEPVIGRWLPTPVSFSDTFYFKPREANTVCYDGTCC